MGTICTKNSKINYSNNLNKIHGNFTIYSSNITFCSMAFFFNQILFHLQPEQNINNNHYEIIILNSQNNYNIKNHICLDPDKINFFDENFKKSLKILFEFKELIILNNEKNDNYKPAKNLLIFINFLNEIRCFPKNIYIISEELKFFFSYFELFNEKNIDFENFNIPFLIFDYFDIFQKIDKKKKISNKIFFQDFEKFKKNYILDPFFYNKFLKITKIYYENNENEQVIEKNDKYIFFEYKCEELNALLEKQNIKNEKILIVYRVNGKIIINILKEILKKMLKLQENELNHYFDQIFININLETSSKEKNPIISKKEIEIKEISSEKANNRCEILTNLLKTERKNDYNLYISCTEILLKLLDKLILNPNEEKYHIIKKSNPILSKSIFSIQNSSKILEQIGFIPENPKNDTFQNRLDIFSLKLIKIDLELAIKNSLI